jgi:hypothetical protein
VFDRVMSEFATVRKELGSDEGSRNAVAHAILEALLANERNLQIIEFQAGTAGRLYLKKLRL